MTSMVWEVCTKTVWFKPCEVTENKFNEKNIYIKYKDNNYDSSNYLLLDNHRCLWKHL